jgi:glycosyltransferase involved in cell wall biosynthesis
MLCDPGNASALAAQLSRLLANPPLRRQMGECGRARARECFSVEGQMARLTQIYEEVVEERRREAA